jgi:hypothetical protein
MKHILFYTLGLLVLIMVAFATSPAQVLQQPQQGQMQQLKKGTPAQNPAIDRMGVNLTPPGQFDPVKLVNDRVDALQAELTGLKKQNAALQQQVGTLQQQVGKLRTDLDRVVLTYANPKGVLGVSQKLMQKAFWDRIPNEALLVYYSRP